MGRPNHGYTGVPIRIHHSLKEYMDEMKGMGDGRSYSELSEKIAQRLRGQNSPFAKSFISNIRENQKKFLGK